MTEKRGKILEGPWKGIPEFLDEQVDSQKIEEQHDQSAIAPHARVVPVAPCEEFSRIIRTAKNENMSEGRVSSEMRQYRRWSLEQLLLFVNNPLNHAVLIQKPVFALALHELIRKKR